jgi:lambda family phage portal protein
MGVFSAIRNFLAPQKTEASPVFAKAKPRKMDAAFDNAQTSTENQNHWAMADALSANAAMDASTRATLRERSRYEAENNSYYSGLLKTLSDDLIGTGPRLQLTLPGDDDRKVAKSIERAFGRWLEAANIPEKLRLMHVARIRDGESFALIHNNPAVAEGRRTRVTLDIKLYEAEQVSDPWDWGTDPLYTDGIRYDSLGNVESYTFLKEHPGGVNSYFSWETMTIPASSVLHWYRPYRAGQARGVPELQSALGLFAQSRRYTLATLTAAETAAMLAGIMKSNAPPGNGSGDSEEDDSTFDKVPLTRGTLLTLPPGFDASQFKPEQPTGTYKEFKTELINEIGRGEGVPLNVILGNSSGYNYSSGRLDHLGYHRKHEVDRARLSSQVLNRLFTQWVDEASLVGDIPSMLPAFEEWSWQWFFDGFKSIDPLKDANADSVGLNNGTLTLAEVYSDKGMDWEDAMRQRAREMKLARGLGLTLPELAPVIPDAQPEETEAVA